MITSTWDIHVRLFLSPLPVGYSKGAQIDSDD
jgi:hypothetical protein